MSKSAKVIFGIFILFIFLFLITTYSLKEEILRIYRSQKSIIIKDRKGFEVAILPNERGYFARYLDEIPPSFKELLLKKEDKYFYYHLGFNPGSIFKYLLGKVGIGERKALSTITQQLVKILLGKETERNFKNKIIELFYALSLEIHLSKEEILKMYVNSIYFGNQAQGLKEASFLYFGIPPEFLGKGEILQLLATLSNPNEQNPAQPQNIKVANFLIQKLDLEGENFVFRNFKKVRENMKKYSRFDDSYFELKSFLGRVFEDRELTIDIVLTKKIREILKRNIEIFFPRNVKNGAIIVVKLPENEILALVGSPSPQSFYSGYQINMLTKERPVGSTIKPFIYLKGFEKGLRPYTLVEDREYKYITALGFPLYPKNFDFKYRGEVTLHYALANSLNVPAVKVLEFVGLEDFYHFLEEDLNFKPVQELDNYQLGISLGALEMNLFDLARYFTIFPNGGILREPRIFKSQSQSIERRISEEKYIQLINKILQDRKTGVEQFGLKSNLNLPYKNYALKTGTSRDFRDSWVIGYTPDFLVGVWLGNADNSPMEGISGQVGAGKIWAEVIELLFNSEYNKNTPFKFNFVQEFQNSGKIEFGLEFDDYGESRNLLRKRDKRLILQPHEGDIFLLEEGTRIFLEAKEKVFWLINGRLIGEGRNQIFVPKQADVYQIKAQSFNGLEEKITIFVR
jgi:penicillin-binding protein 1C